MSLIKQKVMGTYGDIRKKFMMATYLVANNVSSKLKVREIYCGTKSLFMKVRY